MVSIFLASHFDFREKWKFLSHFCEKNFFFHSIFCHFHSELCWKHCGTLKIHQKLDWGKWKKLLFWKNEEILWKKNIVFRIKSNDYILLRLKWRQLLILLQSVNETKSVHKCRSDVTKDWVFVKSLRVYQIYDNVHLGTML